MKATTISIIIALVFIGGAFILSKGAGSTQSFENVNDVNIIDGKQIIEITAKGGFEPQESIAKAGIPTVIRFNTRGTFDCSSSIRIPSLGISKILPQTGSTDIDIGSPTVATLQGTCGMGMYTFEVDFQA